MWSDAKGLHMQVGLACTEGVVRNVIADATLGWGTQIEWTDAAAAKEAAAVKCSAGKLGGGFTILLTQPEGEQAASDWLHVQLDLDEVPRSLDNSQRLRWVLRWDGTKWKPANFDAYTKSITVAESADSIQLASNGLVVEAQPAYQDLPPWESPYVQENIKSELRTKWEAMANESGSLPLNLEAPPLSAAEEPSSQAGCSLARIPSKQSQIPWGGAAILMSLLVGLCLSGWKRRRAVGLCLLVSAASVLVPVATCVAETRYVYGYVSFWDTRPKSSETAGPGCRVCWCDTADTTCLPWQDDCCFHGLPRIRLDLCKLNNNICTVVGTSYTDENGFYLMWDPSWTTGLYRLNLTFSRTDEPFWARLVGAPPSTVPYSVLIWQFQFSSTFHSVPNISLNAVGDTTSAVGDMATYWATVTEAAYALETESDIRLRKNRYSSNTFDWVNLRYYTFTPPSFSNCNDINILPARTRLTTVAHELGHVYHCRAVGTFFPYAEWAPHDYYGPEGNNLTEAIAALVALFTWWSPDTSGTVDIYNDYADCAYELDGHDCCNRARADRNSYMGLWELIDTQTGNSTPNYVDQYNITMSQLMDGVIEFMDNRSILCTDNADCQSGEACRNDLWGGSLRCHGRNRTSDERWRTATTARCFGATSDVRADQCLNDQACNPNNTFCYSGDINGGNVMDLAYNIATRWNMSVPTARATLSSSLCLGPHRDVAPFNGGFTDD